MSMDLRLRAYQPNGAALGLLPTPQEFDAGAVLGDVGAFSASYPVDGPRWALLDQPCEVALEVTYDGGQTWTEPNNMRFLRLRRSGDQVEQVRLNKYEGPGYVWRLTKAKVLPEGLLNADGKRAFLSATPGTILRTLTQEAQARGALAGMDFSTFTADDDSNGQPWAKVVTLYYEPGVDYLTILMNLQDQGLLDFAMVGRSLRIYNADTVMAGPSGATLYRGRDLTEAPFRGTLENLSDYAYLAGDNGVALERTNPEASAPWGRWETYISQGGVSDTGTMTVLSDASLALTESERVERTYGLAFTDSTPLPFLDYALGQDVTVRTTGGSESLRLRQITLSRDADGAVGGSVVLNDRFLENDVRQNRRIGGITGGATMDGGSGARPNDGPDRTIPSAPSGVIATSDAYTDDAGRVFATIAVDWAEVTTNTDGTATTDLAQYEVLYRLTTDTVWTNGPTVEASATSASFGGLEPARDYEVGVRAVDESLHRSGLTSVTLTTADDDVAPEAPSTPLVAVYLGQLLITWDGLNDLGGAPPVDFDRVEVHVGTAPTFAPSAATLVDTITSPAGGSTVATDLTYDTAYYARLVAYDVRGNVSPPSAAASGTPVRAADGDITSMVADKITAGAISAAITVSGRIATALTGARVEMNSNGLKAYDGSGALTVDVPSDGSGPTFVGTFRTAFTGARAELKAVTGSAAILLYSGMASETAPGGLSTTVFGSGSTADAVITIAAPQKNGLDRATIQLNSRDADTGADMTFSHYNGSIYWSSDVGYGTHHYRDTGTSTDWGEFSRTKIALAGGPTLVLDGDATYVMDGQQAGDALYVYGQDAVTVGRPSAAYTQALILNASATTLLTGNTQYKQTIYTHDFRGGFFHGNAGGTSGGDLNLTDPYGNYRIQGRAAGGSEAVISEVIYNRTYTTAASLTITSAGVIGRSTSSERYKVAIDRQAVQRMDLDAIKALNPVTYYDKGNAERYATLVDQVTQGQEPDVSADDAEHPRELLGLIAEDVEALGLELLIGRDEDGTPNAVQYDRVAVALLPWLRDLETRVAALEAHPGKGRVLT